MSTERRAKVGYPKGPDGKPLCRFCKGPVKPPKRTFCSDGCVEQHRIRSDAQFMRKKVFERDKGICCKCGLDTEAINEKLAGLGKLCWAFPRPHNGLSEIECEQIRNKAKAEKAEYIRWMESQGFHPGRTLWEADHILEVVNGGGMCGLDNLQTLCIPCHKAKTKALHRQLADKRRGAQTPELFPTEVRQ